VDAVHALERIARLWRDHPLRAAVAFATIFRPRATFVRAFGAAPALASLIYGVIAYSTRQRTQEIAIRMAMGASASDVVRLVMGQGFRMTLLGLALGLAGSVAVARLLRTHLYGVSPLDPATFGGHLLC
jgi:putative ABC transport system permease protein